MTVDGFMTAEEMKKILNLKTDTDNRTINKYVILGKLEVKFFSNKTKLYRFAQNDNTDIKKINDEEWIFEKQAKR